MAELTETEILAKITIIDANIATITSALGSGGATAAQYVDYSMGSKSVSGSQQLEQLLKLREYYQNLLTTIPSSGTDHAVYDIEPGTGKNDSEEIGDEAT